MHCGKRFFKTSLFIIQFIITIIQYKLYVRGFINSQKYAMAINLPLIFFVKKETFDGSLDDPQISIQIVQYAQWYPLF